MSFKGFEKFRHELFREQFRGENLHPIIYGLERNAFEKRRLRQLIDVGEGVDAITVKSKLVQWKRQIKRLEKVEERFLRLAGEFKLNGGSHASNGHVDGARNGSVRQTAAST